MNAEELLEEWEDGESTGVRPERVKVIRDDLYRVTGMLPPRRVSEIESWLESMKGQVTRKLRNAAETTEDSESEDDE